MLQGPAHNAQQQNAQQQPPRQTTILAQSVPNPNNNRQSTTLTYHIEFEDTASVSAIQCNDIQLRSRKKLVERSPPLITEVEDNPPEQNSQLHNP